MSQRQDISTGSPYEPPIGIALADVRPVNTVRLVSRFIDPDWLVETEVDAVLEPR